MRGWRLIAVVPLTLVVMGAGVVVLAFLAVAIPSSIAFHILNTGGE